MPLTPEQQAEIAEARADAAPTRRAVAPGLEERLFEAIPVLDHGFVRVVDYMGDDAAIVQAARVSYGRGTKAARDDRGLIRYLLRHAHSTPFEMCEIKLHVKLPIFVARQWIRHRTANVNEYSARYSILDREFYVPVYAEALCGMVADWVPLAYGAFADYRLGGATLGAQAMEAVRRMARGETVTFEDSGMSKGEWREFRALIDAP
jgi:hypothetical protein